MEFHFREGYGWRGQGITVIVNILVIGVFLIAIIINSNDTTITSSSSSSSPVSANTKRKLNEVTSKVDKSSNDDYPHLLRALGKEEYGFNPRDPSIQKIMQGLLAELIDLLSKDYELNIIDSANNSVSYIHVPKTSSNGSFQNSKEWLDVAIKVAGTKHGGTYEAAHLS